MKKIYYGQVIVTSALVVVSAFVVATLAPWNWIKGKPKQLPNFENQEAALDACIKFTQQALSEELKQPRPKNLEEILNPNEEEDFVSRSLFKNDLGEYQIIRYGCKRYGDPQDQIPHFYGWVDYLEIPNDRDKGRKDYKVSTFRPFFIKGEDGGLVYAKPFTYTPQENDQLGNGRFDDSYGINQDWIVGIAFGMSHNLCKELYLHKTLTLDDLKNRKSDDLKLLKKSPDTFANQPYPQQKINLAVGVYEAEIKSCEERGEQLKPLE